MKKRLVFSIFCISALLACYAETLTPEQALNRALTGSQHSLPAVATCKYQLSSSKEYEGKPALYLFQNSVADGFLIVSAKDKGPAILGYGDSKLCDITEEMPPQFEWWIAQLARQVAYNESHRDASDESVIRKITRPQRAPIEPLCQTTWNQGAPYNNQCPMVGENRSVTGCVATAMSQVMKYHNWPPEAEGENSYTWNNQDLAINFNLVKFNWSKMLDSYPMVGEGDSRYPAGTQEEQDAVALLMKAAGYSVNMSYSPNASGAVSLRIAPALGNYFQYDRSLRYLERDCYSLNDWEEIIYRSLVEDGPVIYDGQSTIGGHSFVCDGYSSDGYFHFNWGWGGLSDGYFLLDALDPLHQGIGGADGGFDFMQDIIVGIRPNHGDGNEWSYSMLSDGGIDMKYDSSENVIYTETLIYNGGPGVMESPALGFKFTPVDGGAPEIVDEQMYEPLDLMYGWSQFGLDMPSLANGKYRVRMVYKPYSWAKEYTDVNVPIYAVSEYLATVSGSRISNLEPIGLQRPIVDNVDAPWKIENDELFNLDVTLTNPNDVPYMCYLRPYLIVLEPGQEYDEETLEAAEARLQVLDMDAKSTEKFKITIDFNYEDLWYSEDDKAYLVMYEEDPSTGWLYKISDLFPVMIDGIIGAVNQLHEDVNPDTTIWYSISGSKVAEVSNHAQKPELETGVYLVKSGKIVKKVVIK